MRELEPRDLWGYFDDILKIPRLSKNEGKILNYLVEFAKSRNLEYNQDQVGNLLIRKKATPGMEESEIMILQSHVDMVGEKLSDTVHDFHTDAIQVYIEDGWIRARGTTLGADDGIGVAASLAILASDTIKHGPLECFFTVDEETGMTGAFGLEAGFLEGKTLLNLDSEDEGEIFIGCAGGIDTVGRFKLNLKRVPRNRVAYRVSVDGLQGGHSGDEIHKGFSNGIKLLNRFLWNADQRFDLYLSSFEGGKLRNAIPRQAAAVIVMPGRTAEMVKIYFNSFRTMIRSEIGNIESSLTIEMEQVDLPEYRYTRRFQRKLMNTLYAIPHGTISMCHEIPGLVETSTNLAIVRKKDDEFLEIVTSQRSSVESAKRDISDRIGALFTLAGGEVLHSEGYPGWKPDKNSAILKMAVKTYEDLFHTKPAIKAIHAGLECGLFLVKYPGLDMISFGPTIKGAHTPEERIQVETVKKFWDFLVRLIEEAPLKKT